MRILSPSQGQRRILPTPYQKLENLQVLIWILNWLWIYGPPINKEEDHLRQPFSLFLFSRGMSFCVYLCIFCLCFLSSHTNFYLISRMGQAQNTSLGLVLSHFKDFC